MKAFAIQLSTKKCLYRGHYLEALEVTLIALLCIQSVQAADDERPSAPPRSAHLLVGGLRHSEQLPPLPDQFSPGRIFTESKSGAVPAPSRHAAVPEVNEVKKPPPASSISARNSGTVKSVPDASNQLRSYLRLQAKNGNPGTYGLSNYMKTEAKAGYQPKHFGNVKSLAPRHSNQVDSDSDSDMGRVDELGKLLKFQIPTWIAGVWQRADSTELTRIDLPSGKKDKPAGKTVSKTRDSFGTYRDGRGVIWQVFDPSRASGVVDRGDNVDHHTVLTYKIENLSPTKVTVKIGATHVVVNKATHKIVTSYQDEELNQFTRIDANHLRTDSSVKVFDAKGKPHLLTTSTSTEDRIAHL